MKRSTLFFATCGLLFMTTGCARYARTAVDITPGNISGEKLDAHYGANDIRIQTTKLNATLMDRWLAKTGYDLSCGTPRIIITCIDNCTNQYISTDMIRDIFEGAAVNDGRYTVIVGNYQDTNELNALLNKYTQDPRYSSTSKPQFGALKAPQFLAKVRITNDFNYDPYYVYEDYRMSVSLYDIETQELIDSAWDVLKKRVRR